MESNNNKYVPAYKKLKLKPIALDFDKDSSDQQQMIPPVEIETVKEQNIDLDSVEPLYTIEDVTVPEEEKIIDNNDYVNFPSEPISSFSAQESIKEDLNDHILMVNDKILLVSTKNDIQHEVEMLLYGEHPAFDSAVNLSDISVLKKVNIRYGIFLGD